MESTETRRYKILSVSPGPLDAKRSVGVERLYSNIQSLIDSIPNSLVEGMIVDDSNFSVSWQIYKDGETWKYRLHQGMFYVSAVSTATLDPESMTTLPTIDGVTGAEGNVVLLVGEFYPKDNGVWVMSEDGWYRHPIFDENSDQIGGVYFKVSGGTKYKNSLWQLSNYGEITIGTTELYFEQSLLQTEINTNSITAPVRYSKLNPLLNQNVTLGINLVPGLEYIVQKDNNIDATVVLWSPGTFNYVGTLSKKDDWVRMIPTTGYAKPDGWFVMSSDERPKETIAHVMNGPTGNIYLKKENVYAYYGANTNELGRNIYLPIDCYDDFVYYVFHAAYSLMGTEYSRVYDYDGNLLSEVTGVDNVDVYAKPALTKYCTAKNIASSNSALKIKIPAGWKLKDIVIEHTPTTTQATGSFVCSTTDPVLGDQFTIGDETYTLVQSRTNKYEVTFNASPTTLATNMVSAINIDSKYVTALRSSANVNLTAKSPYMGTLGNSITITENSPGLTVSGATLASGTTTWPGDVTIDIGTTSGGNDIVDDYLVSAQSLNTVGINKILSKTEAKTLYVSSANWNSASVTIYATRDEGISKSL